MSRRARLFSEFLSTSGSDVGRTTTAPTAAVVSQDGIPKRRKTSGLNSRFDRMVQTMNITHRSPVRKRARSTSSASGSSVPKTPIDEFYDEFHRDSKLGPEFSVIKMGDKKKRVKQPVVLPWEKDSSSSDIADTSPSHPPLPTWLADTFSTLNTQHPLRNLLPRRTNTEPTSSSPSTLDQDTEDNPFSFSVPDNCPSPSATPKETENIPALLTQAAQSPPDPARPAFIYRPPSPPDAPMNIAPPFSTPGPASTISKAVISRPIPPPLCFPEPVLVDATPATTPMLQNRLSEQNHFGSTFSSLPQLYPAPVFPSVDMNMGLQLKKAHPFEHPNSDATSLTLSPSRLSAEDIAIFNAPLYPISEESTTRLMDNASYIHNAHTELFSTPGPGYHTGPPVYFDSPTEDPSDSDPLEPSYELDSLDFRWEPFIQSAENAIPATETPAVVRDSGDDYYYEVRVDPEGEDDADGPLYASINMGTTSVDQCPSPSQSRFSFAPPADELPSPVLETRESHQPARQTPDPPFFAPGGGIYISPLRGGDPPTQTVNAPPMDPSSSQDTIEDWDDVDAN
ncbi:hypothetical protein R3P38DRAFT_1165764 [Favolaschia claudopus]|uniref:Uncharacterized protein n=1 Tax=Favolaschia claudopus TaxID=2862362 RepID=A0AAW0DWE8_9AGAR